MTERIKKIWLYSNSTFESVLGMLLFLYLALYFIFPYKPFHLPISPSSLILIFGIVILGLYKVLEFKRGQLRISADIIIFCGMVLFFLLSSVIVHHKNFSWRPGFFAYLFSFLCFIFVRATIQYATPNSLYKSMTFYLIVSGILILLQVRSSTNMFYVSRFFEYQTSFK